jgi:streptogramin lyase
MLLAGILAAALSPLPAQDLDVYWQANRKSKDVTKISASGEILLTVDLSKNIPTGQTTSAELRSAHMAPDGKVWIVNFIRPYFTLLDSKGKILQNVNTKGGGSPYTIAFDKAGNAYISNPGSAVEMYDKNAKFVKDFKIGGNALGLTIDSQGQIWASHRTGPPSKVTKIDPVKGTWTDFPLPVTTKTLGGQVVAGYNGLLQKSDIFVIGDRSSELVHFDNAGKVQGTFTIDPSSTTISAMTIDANNNVWIGSFRSPGNIYKFDTKQKKVVRTIANSPNVLGLAIDSNGRLLATTRVSFAGPQPSEVRRYNVTTNILEQVSVVGLGAGSAASSGFHRALVLDPFGDADGDKDPNFSEVTKFTAPFDSQSNNKIDLKIIGSNKAGSTVELRASGQVGSKVVIGFSQKRLTVPLTNPAWVGALRIGPLAPLFYFGTAPFAVKGITIPSTIPLGTTVHLQALYEFNPTLPVAWSNDTAVIVF